MRTAIGGFGLLLALTWASLGWAQGPVEGRDFTRIVPAHATADVDRVVVTEFFSYQCPHCFAFSQPFNRWSNALPKDVVCRREAVDIGHESWQPSARAFYALESIGKLDVIDDAFFGAVHREHVPLRSEAQVTSWLASQGVSAQQFSAAYRSFDVDRQVKRSRQLSIAVKLPSVPAITIDGKYLVEIASNISFDKQLAVVDALIAKARAEKKP
jgi:protein dithiol oxidoreductase (disulfide-forming)